jgi:hypothetical protein
VRQGHPAEVRRVLIAETDPMDRGGGLTVLVVEADADERDRLGTVLERSGYDVVMCPGPVGPDYI